MDFVKFNRINDIIQGLEYFKSLLFTGFILSAMLIGLIVLLDCMVVLMGLFSLIAIFLLEYYLKCLK